MKTKEQIAIYNKEYFARPEVKARAKIRNAQRRVKRKEYKKTERGREADKRYRRGKYARDVLAGKHLKARYGITLEEYNELLEKQDGKCAICQIKPEQKLHVDHCHNTKRVRGLLCGSCNRALGLLKDNTDFLNKAIDYLMQ